MSLPGTGRNDIVDDLIDQLVQRFGLSAEQGQEVLGVVMGFFKDKLPADLMNQLTGAMPDLGKVLGDVQGAVSDAAGQATAAAADAAGAAQGAVSDAAGAAQGAAGAATDAAGSAKDAAADAAGSAKDAAGGLLDSVKGLFGKG